MHTTTSLESRVTNIPISITPLQQSLELQKVVDLPLVTDSRGGIFLWEPPRLMGPIGYSNLELVGHMEFGALVNLGFTYPGPLSRAGTGRFPSSPSSATPTRR